MGKGAKKKKEIHQFDRERIGKDPPLCTNLSPQE